jgi:uroporphyrinogen-III synthase
MSVALENRRILIPRAGRWGSIVAAQCADRGAVGVIAPVIETKRPLDTAALATSIDSLQRGEYSWLFVTSSSTVDVLREFAAVLPPTTAIAAVGAATARALAEAGYSVAFMPHGPTSARALVEQWKRSFEGATGLRILVMRSDLAAATISDELGVAGHRVDVCVAYRTVGVNLEPTIRRDLEGGMFDAVLVTSNSVAIELTEQLRVIPQKTLFASIGAGTAAEAERLGLNCRAVASSQTVEGLLDAVDLYFAHPSEGGTHHV